MGNLNWHEDEVPVSESDNEMFQNSEQNIFSDNICFKEYEGASEIIEDRKNLYSEVWEQDDHYHTRKDNNLYYPFAGCIEWEMVQWLHSLDAPMDKVDAFFKLQYVSLISESNSHWLTIPIRLRIVHSHFLLHKRCEHALNCFQAHPVGKKKKFRLRGVIPRSQ